MTEREDLIRRAEACERLADGLEGPLMMGNFWLIRDVSVADILDCLESEALRTHAADLRRQAGEARDGEV